MWYRRGTRLCLCVGWALGASHLRVFHGQPGRSIIPNVNWIQCHAAADGDGAAPAEEMSNYYREINRQR